MNNKINKLKTIVVLPAYNAQDTLIKTYNDIPHNVVDEIILVDDCSSDNTVEIAKKLNLSSVISHQKNSGYGANQKTCYSQALKKGADIIVMLHPDYQYDPKLILYFIQLIKDDYFDMMLGTRIRSRREALDAGMPIYKYYSNRFLTLIENCVTGYNLSEWHTGMRAYKREVLENINFSSYSNDFVFDSQLMFSVIQKKYRIGEISVPVKYFPEASSINFSRSLKYGIQTLLLALHYLAVSFFRNNK